MKLYYSPGACSLSPHIVLEEAGLPYEPVLASTKTHKLPDGTDYYTINPKGYVPLLELDDGQRLTEGPAIVQYLADLVPGKKLAPANGTMARYRLQEWLNFITSELHKGIGGMFNPAMPEEAKALMRARATDRLKWVDNQLAGKALPDGRCVQRRRCLPLHGRPLEQAGRHRHLRHDRAHAYLERVAARPAVQAAMQAEGLLKKAA